MKTLLSVSLVAILALLITISAVGWFSGTQPAEPSTDQTAPVDVVRYRIDAGKSKFMVYANRTGLAYFKGKSHEIAVRDFDGEASLDLTAVNPASLQMTIRSASLEETRPIYTDKEKGIINKELNEIVLETAKYPEITFKSTDVKGELKNGVFDLKIGGDITLHGVTKHIVIPATVTIEGNALHAKGDFKLNRKEFHVNATEAFHGLVKVKHVLRFSFDIIAERT
jgi:polyisoprenoid-binding protein YceI